MSGHQGINRQNCDLIGKTCQIGNKSHSCHHIRIPAESILSDSKPRNINTAQQAIAQIRPDSNPSNINAARRELEEVQSSQI